MKLFDFVQFLIVSIWILNRHDQFMRFFQQCIVIETIAIVTVSSRKEPIPFGERESCSLNEPALFIHIFREQTQFLLLFCLYLFETFSHFECANIILSTYLRLLLVLKVSIWNVNIEIHWQKCMQTNIWQGFWPDGTQSPKSEFRKPKSENFRIPIFPFW